MIKNTLSSFALCLIILLSACSSLPTIGPTLTPAPTATLPPTTTPIPTPTLTHRCDELTQGVVTVPPRQFYHVPFVVDTLTMKNINVRGEFIAHGGSGNDIIALVLDDTNFRNWANGLGFKAVYVSGQITVGQLNVPITAPGAYYLVFDNTFSIISAKTVDATVALCFEQ